MATPKQKPPREQLRPEVCKALFGGDSPNADTRQLLLDIIRLWGGTAAIAGDMVAEFKKAPPGGVVRQRTLQMIQSLIIMTTNQGLASSVRPEDMSEEELVAVIKKYAPRLAVGTQETA